MENAELFAQVRAKINESMQRAIARDEVDMDMLFLYTQLQILERLEAMHDTLLRIDSSTDSLSSHLLHEYIQRNGKKDTP